jgi:hypothetical protein
MGSCLKKSVTKALPCFDHLVERRQCKQELSMIAGETNSIYDIVHEVNKCARDHVLVIVS